MYGDIRKRMNIHIVHVDKYRYADMYTAFSFNLFIAVTANECLLEVPTYIPSKVSALPRWEGSRLQRRPTVTGGGGAARRRSPYLRTPADDVAWRRPPLTGNTVRRRRPSAVSAVVMCRPPRPDRAAAH